MAKKATLRIQFNLNQRTGVSKDSEAVHRGLSNFKSIIIHEVGLQTAEIKHAKIKREIRQEIAADVHREVANIAKLYARHVIGRSGIRNRTVNLTASTTSVEGVAVFGKWKPLSSQTVARKGHANFFRERGQLGLIMSDPKVWEHAFGPVQVRVTKLFNSPKLSPYKKDGEHFKVASISVSALGRITSGMLPELLSGKLGSTTHRGRSAGLLNLLDAADPSLKFELGNWNRSGSGDYRPSLEPFLAFALTKAIPQAVFQRIRDKGARSSKSRQESQAAFKR